MSDLVSFLDRFVSRVWVAGDSAAIPELMAPDAVISGLEEMEQEGPGDFARFHAMISRQIEWQEVKIVQALEQGEWVSAVYACKARDRRRGAPVSFVAHVTCCVQAGKITRAYNLIDFLSVFEQLGRLPPRTLDLCLLEKRLEPV